YFQGLSIVALALAGIALDIDIGQEVHLDLDDAIALAGLAAPTLDVEGKAAGLVAASGRLGQAGEPVGDGGEGAGGGGGVGARGAPDGRLVDVDDLVEMLQPFDTLVLARMKSGAVELAGERLVERLDDEGGLAAARNPGDAGEGAERDVDTDVLQV